MGKLLRRLGTRDAALIVMGGIIGSGIFMNPSVVARYVHTGPLVMLAWAAGGVIALLGAGLFAELAARRPTDGGLYAYMRDAYHPAVAFCYGWTLLLVSQSGGTAAAAVTFAAYFVPLTGLHVDSHILAVAVLALFTVVNCLGVRQGANTQNAFMIGKIVLIVALVVVGLFAPHATNVTPAQPLPSTNDLLLAFGLALVPVLFAYSGWQTSSFMSAELRDPHKTLPRGMWLGVGGVVVLYLAVNAVCVWALGANALAATHTPASDIARLAFGPVGERIMAAVIAISTLGFISNQILTSPRVYFQMAAEGVFFKALAKIDPRTHVPMIAIAVQGIVAIVIALSGQYDAILNFVTSVDYVFFGLSALALFIFRKRDAEANVPAPSTRMPGHPYTTGLFLVVAWAIVLDVVLKAPIDAAVGLGILLTGVPVYWLFAQSRRARSSTPAGGFTEN